MLSPVVSYQEMLKTGHLTLPDLVKDSVVTLELSAIQTARYADQWGYDCDPYTELTKQIDRTIALLRQQRQDVQAMRPHEHCWDHNNYCAVCGIDGLE
jgi:hypothetical protein